MPPTSGVLLRLLVLHMLVRSSYLSGCLFLRDDRIIRCQNTSLADIPDNLHVLTMVVLNRPHTVEVDDCSAGHDGELPPIFVGIRNASIDTVRVRRSGLTSLHADVFHPVARALRDLDLSHNLLTTIPRALVVLRSLEHLDLRHNRIVFLRPDGVLDALVRLRELNLANNFIGLATEDIGLENGYQLKGSLKLEDFDLGQSGLSLESLNLSGNRLVTVPDQITGRRLPELRHLDLSENVIARVDDLHLLDQLRFLDLHSNRIQSVPFYALPPTLQDLDLTGNPLSCDCAALWLFEWAEFINDTSLRLPLCHAPDRFKDRTLQEVPWVEECPEAKPTFRFMTHGSGEYDVVELTSNSTSITISWRVRTTGGGDQQHGSNSRPVWTVVYRREGDSPHRMTPITAPQPQTTSTPSNNNLFHLTIAPLPPLTTYVVCVAVVREGKYAIEPDKCGRVGTTAEDDARGGIHTELVEVAPSANAITISWRLVAPMLATQKKDVTYRHEWTIRVRRTGSDNYTDVPVYDLTLSDETDDQLYEYALSDLSPRTHYDVCLVDVEHSPIGENRTSTGAVVRTGTEMCTTVQTASRHLLYGGEIAAVVFACAICLVIAGLTVILCRQRRLFRCRRPCSLDRFTATLPRVHLEPPPPPPSEKEPNRNTFAGAWNTMRLPYTDFSRPEFRSFRTVGYRDALTTVTIYRSGYSEC